MESARGKAFGFFVMPWVKACLLAFVFNPWVTVFFIWVYVVAGVWDALMLMRFYPLFLFYAGLPYVVLSLPFSAGLVWLIRRGVVVRCWQFMLAGALVTQGAFLFGELFFAAEGLAGRVALAYIFMLPAGILGGILFWWFIRKKLGGNNGIDR